MLSINDVIEHNNISRRIINNRINKLKSIFPSLIKGGGKGKGGRYYFDDLLLADIFKPNSQLFLSSSETEILRFRQSTFINSFKTLENYRKKFDSIEWKYWGCFRTKNNIISQQELVKMIQVKRGDILFYAIHTIDLKITDPSHIHFVLKTDEQSILQLKKYCRDLHPHLLINCDIVEFDSNKLNCFDYMTDVTRFKPLQRTSEYSFVLGY
jgi:hypothetical protein